MSLEKFSTHSLINVVVCVKYKGRCVVKIQWVYFTTPHTEFTFLQRVFKWPIEYLTVWGLNKGESDTAYAQFRLQDFSPDLGVCDSLCVGKKHQTVGKSERAPANEGWRVNCPMMQSVSLPVVW